MAEPGVARCKQAGRELFQVALGIYTTFLANKLQPKIEDEDEQEDDCAARCDNSG